MVSLLDGCSGGCGIAAAILAALSWGTFGVPIKCNVDVEVNFFVMQSYKTIVCFLTSWLVIFLGEPVRWTSWGIVSGLFWVPGAACGIYGIRNAGVAVAVGTWSSIQVCTSCLFGIIIFQEKVKDMNQTIVAFILLMVGLVGMSRYSDSSQTSSIRTIPITGHADSDLFLDYFQVATKESNDIIDSAVPTSRFLTPKKTANSMKRMPDRTTCKNKVMPLEMDVEEKIMEPLLHGEEMRYPKDRVHLFGGRFALTKRQMGLLGAVVNGAWGGLNLIPLHYAQRDSGMSGASYLISYASGSMIVCISIWGGLFGYHFTKRDYSVFEALEQLPAWHLKELGFPGMLAGLFYSIGNFCSILAVAYLGQGVGFSFCQGQLLVSGLWGVFYFKEIQGRETIIKWFASAIVAVFGIVCLSYQHEGGSTH